MTTASVRAGQVGTLAEVSALSFEATGRTQRVEVVRVEPVSASFSVVVHMTRR